MIWKYSLILLVWLPYSARAQSADAAPLDIEAPALVLLENALTSFLESERDAKLKAFDELKSSEWQDLLPSLGVAYTPLGSPRPSASWSPLQVLDRREHKKKRRLDRQSIILAYEIALTDRLYKLHQLYHDYQIDLIAIQDKQPVIDLENELFEITEGKYKANLIKPSEYLTAKKSLLQVLSRHKQNQQELLKRRNALLYEAKLREEETGDLTLK